MVTSETSITIERRVENRRKPKLPKPEWFWVTRATGFIMAFYGMVVDKSPDRGTLIITGAGLMGVDKVLRPPGGGAPPTTG